MTEKDWLTCKKLESLVAHLKGMDVSERKMRLFACVCCRRVKRCTANKTCLAAIDITERYYDGLATEDEHFAALDLMQAGHGNKHIGVIVDFLLEDANCDFEGEENWPTFLGEAYEVAARAEALGDRKEQVAQCALFRDIVGNPFRPLPPRKGKSAWTKTMRGWLARSSGIAQNLAKSIYDKQAFDRMPILGDALEDAGCADQELLVHCRGEEPHVRGCWVVDLILDKS